MAPWVMSIDGAEGSWGVCGRATEPDLSRTGLEALPEGPPPVVVVELLLSRITNFPLLSIVSLLRGGLGSHPPSSSLVVPPLAAETFRRSGSRLAPALDGVVVGTMSVGLSTEDGPLSMEGGLAMSREKPRLSDRVERGAVGAAMRPLELLVLPERPRALGGSSKSLPPPVRSL